jgi:uncharacterized protein YbjT (DUF2867 family)
MYAIMGITGQIGGVVARTLLAARRPVRAVVRLLEAILALNPRRDDPMAHPLAIPAC